MSAPSVAEKALDVLEAIAALDGGSLPEIVERCGLPVTTTHRIVETLVRRGFVMRAGRGDYRLGGALLDVAAGMSRPDLLRSAARAHLPALARKVRSHVHLGILEDGMVTYLVKQRHGRMRLHSAEGKQLEAYCSALGKVLLASLSEHELDSYLGEGGFVPLTAQTITDAAGLRREVHATRERGWGSDLEESARGLRCIAAPARDRHGHTVAAISVSTLSHTGTPAELFRALPPLLETAREIGRLVSPPGHRAD